MSEGFPGPGDYRDEVELDLLGRRVRVLELSREVSETMPVYPGHVKVAFWDHLTHEQVRRQRLPADSPFRGYAVRGLVASEPSRPMSTRSARAARARDGRVRRRAGAGDDGADLHGGRRALGRPVPVP